MVTLNLDTLVVNGGSAQAGGDYELIDPGTYVVTITDIDTFEGRNFKTGEPETKLKFIYKVVDDPRNSVQGWEGTTLDELVSIPKNMANERARLGLLWKAATGETPVEGGQYPIKKGLLGKQLLLVVSHRKPNANGAIWPNVDSYAPAAAPGAVRRRGQVAQVVVDNDDDDLRDA